MSKDAKIIEWPVAPAARQSRLTDQQECAGPTVIDLEARRQGAIPSDAAHGILRNTDCLSPGEVWDALDSDRMVVHYQPQYDMQSGRAVAAEALVRLMDTDGQLIFPDRFIDAVEERDLIVPLGRAVIEQVCLDLARCRVRELPIERIAINLSAYQIAADTELLAFIDQAVSLYGLSHGDLEFELTERHGLSSDGDEHAVLRALAARGSRIVVDDFGVGYSSVIYLANLPVAAFKLDRSLVARMLDDAPARQLVHCLLALADNMSLDVVAEGVENDAQRDYLEAAGCPLAQGFGYARPMPADDLMEFAEEEQTGSERSGMDVSISARLGHSFGARHSK